LQESFILVKLDSGFGSWPSIARCTRAARAEFFPEWRFQHAESWGGPAQQPVSDQHLVLDFQGYASSGLERTAVPDGQPKAAPLFATGAAVRWRRSNFLS